MLMRDHFRQELQTQLARASLRGSNHVLINVCDLHASLGDFPNPNELMTCRLAMRSEMGSGDVLLVAANNQAGMTVRYALPR